MYMYVYLYMGLNMHVHVISYSIPCRFSDFPELNYVRKSTRLSIVKCADNLGMRLIYVFAVSPPCRYIAGVSRASLNDRY